MPASSPPARSPASSSTAPTSWSASANPLGQVGRPRVGDCGVGDHVDEVRRAGGEGAVESGTEVVGTGDGLARAAERLHHLVVAAAGLQLGGNVVAVDRLHRMLLEAPDPV